MIEGGFIFFEVDRVAFLGVGTLSTDMEPFLLWVVALSRTSLSTAGHVLPVCMNHM